MRGRQLRIACGALAALFTCNAFAEPLPRITPQAAYAEIARSAELRGVQIDGDLDAEKMQPPPAAKRIVMRDLQLDGTLRSSTAGPELPLWIDNSQLRNIDLRGARWSAALEIENSVVTERARFESAQFDRAFTLHETRFTGPALFRGIRFGGPVEITSSKFHPARPIGVSFTDSQFASPARFDRSNFATGVYFDNSRFDADASFLGLKVTGLARWRNVIFGGDAEFRFCKLGEVDFGDEEQMSVFMHLADFRGCSMRSLRLDFVDARGDLLLINAQVTPGDLTLREASLRGGRNDFSGLKVAGKLDLQAAQILNLEMHWPAISPALLRSRPDSEVLLPLQLRLEELKKDDDARAASALLRDRLIEEELAQPEASLGDKAVLWIERIVWGGATGYGTRLGRITGVALLSWLLLAAPLLVARRVRIGSLIAVSDKALPLHQAVGPEALQSRPRSVASRGLESLAYTFTLMFTMPDLHLRPAKPMPSVWQGYLLFMRGIGLVLLALMALTLAKVSPVIQAVLGKIVE